MYYYNGDRYDGYWKQDKREGKGKYTFVVVFPDNFYRDVLAGKDPTVQVNVDATRMSQAFTGSGYIQQILTQEVNRFVRDRRQHDEQPLTELALTGAALIRERESGTLEHLLVLPLNSAEIMISKIWSMGLVVLVAACLSQLVVVEWIMGVPMEGSRILFVLGLAMYLFAVTSLGIFMRFSWHNL